MEIWQKRADIRHDVSSHRFLMAPWNVRNREVNQMSFLNRADQKALPYSLIISGWVAKVGKGQSVCIIVLSREIPMKVLLVFKPARHGKLKRSANECLADSVFNISCQGLGWL